MLGPACPAELMELQALMQRMSPEDRSAISSLFGPQATSHAVVAAVESVVDHPEAEDQVVESPSSSPQGLSDSDSEPRSLGRGKKQGSKHMVVPVTAQNNPPSPNDVYRKKRRRRRATLRKAATEGFKVTGGSLSRCFATNW